MNLYPTIPDERAKEYDAACEARGETRDCNGSTWEKIGGADTCP